MHVIVVVLGDLGRSPRMQYHCQSLLEAGHYVTFVGYTGEDLIPALSDAADARFQVVRFSVPTPRPISIFKPLYFVWRIVSLTVALSYSLFVSVTRQPVDFVLVQNPPALPLLAVAFVFCRVKAFTQQGRRRPGLIIDWHNLGYSMLLRDDAGSVTQRIAKVYERCMAPLADGHLTVTKAMKEYLQTEMNVTNNVDVLYDCPPLMFHPLPLADQHKILTKLDKQLCQACPPSWYAAKDSNRQTLFTEETEAGGEFRPRRGRPALVTSSTSWTPDEDFGVLLAALQALDDKIKDTELKVLVVVTGKGPEREMYEEKISVLKLQNVAVATLWLEPGDYPSLLACADLGISLHTSTSGLDLPMKVLDCFGCEVPVLAHNFDCLHELVQDGVNGRVFASHHELTELLYELLQPLVVANTSSSSSPVVANHAFGALSNYSKQLQGRDRWSNNWIEHALPVIMLATPM